MHSKLATLGNITIQCQTFKANVSICSSNIHALITIVYSSQNVHRQSSSVAYKKTTLYYHHIKRHHQKVFLGKMFFK